MSSLPQARERDQFWLPMVIETLKERNPIADVIAEDGIALTPKGGSLVGYHSNKHDSESKTSLSVDPEKGLWHCFNCGEGGDVLSWLELNRGMSFMEACRYLAKRAGIRLPDVDPAKQRKYEEHRRERQSLEKVYTAAARFYHKQLTHELRGLCLEKWGLQPETLARYLIGFAPPEGTALKKHLKENGFDPELLKRSGLFVKVEGKGFVDFFQGRLIFPYWKSAQVVYFIGRQTGYTPDAPWEKGKYKKLLTHSEDHPYVSEAVSNEYFAGEDTVRDAEELLITEGIADCYAAIQAGFPCISPVTVTFRKADFPRLTLLARRAKAVYICNDNEENRAGEKGALATAQYLENQGVKTKLIQLPRAEGMEKVDLADYLKEHSAEDLRQLMARGKTPLELLLNELAQDPEDAEKRNAAIEKTAQLSPVERDVYAAELHRILKPLGIKKKTIEEAINGAAKQAAGDADGDEKETQQDVLVRLAGQAELFKNDHREPFARIPVDDHYEIWPVKSRDFKLWLTGKYYDEAGKGPNSEALNAALNTISAQAWRSEKKHKLHVRVAEYDGAFWYDLADDRWRAVKITAGKWEIVDNPPLLFRRYSHMQPQPDPDPDGDLKQLLDFVNLQSDDLRLLYLCAVVTDLVPGIPHIIKVFYGPQGAAKSTLSKVTRQVVDPSAAPTTRSYRDSREFVQHLAHNHVVVLDNLSGISPFLSDQICSAVTGDGDSKRMLYSDDEDVIYNFQRCFIINGINNVVVRPDLLRRSILFRLDPITLDRRKEERDFWREVEKARPGIFGGALNALAGAVQAYPSVRLEGLYPMADFTRWGAAVSEALGFGASAFLQAYSENIGRQNEEALANHPVAAAIMALMAGRGEWIGSPSELLEVLEKVAETERINIKAKSWPKSANSLSRRLNEIKPTLEAAGVNIEREKSGARTIALQRTENTVQTVQPSKTALEQDLRADDIRTVKRTLDDIPSDLGGNGRYSKSPKASNDGGLDDKDDKDGIFGNSEGVDSPRLYEDKNDLLAGEI